MEIINILRRWKSSYIAYKNALKYAKVANLRSLLHTHSNLETVIVAKERLILQLKNKASFEWDLKKPNSFQIATKEGYEVLEQTLIQEILVPGNIVFDIGANFGYFTVLIKKFCPTISLYSFEPIKDTFETLLRNLKHNQLEDVKVFNFGFSNEQATVTFYIPDQLGDAWASMGTGVSAVFNYKLNKEICEVKRIDDFVRDNNIDEINFIKCDVEGAEKLVVEGALHTLKKYRPTLMLEIGNMWTASFGYNREILIRLMTAELNYRCFGILKEKTIEIETPEAVNQYPEQEMYNYFFVHPSNPKVLDVLLNHANKTEV